MSNVIKFPAALKMLAATSGCPSRLILGDEKISSRIIVDLKRAPASRWHWWWCLPAWELWRRASRAPLRRPQPTNHLGPELVMLVLVMMMMVAMVVVFLMKMLNNLLMTKHDNAMWLCFNIKGQNMRPACIPNWAPSSPLNLTSGDFPSFWKIFMVFSWSGIALALWAIGTSPFTACMCNV